MLMRRQSSVYWLSRPATFFDLMKPMCSSYIAPSGDSGGVLMDVSIASSPSHRCVDCIRLASLPNLVAEAIVGIDLAIGHVKARAHDPPSRARRHDRLEEDRVLGFRKVIELLDVDPSLPGSVRAKELLQRLVPPYDVRGRSVEDIERRDQHRILGVLVVDHAVDVIIVEIGQVL